MCRGAREVVLKDSDVPVMPRQDGRQGRNVIRRRKLPQPFQVEEINFRIRFNAPSLECFLVLVTGRVLTFGTHTVSPVILTRGLYKSMHFASVHRFFARASRDPDHGGEQIFRR